MSLEDMYQGHDLPPSSRSIRVLDIYPVPGSSENIQAEPVVCTFRVIDLNDSPHFTALSYVWGKDSPTSQYSIVCEGVQVPVTQNCQSALKHLRQRLGQFSIWVDALCIKQNDLVEKAQQIPLMSDIYSNAAFVYVWLGKGTPATDRAMHYLANNPIEKYFRTSRPIAAAWTLSSAPYNLLKSPIPLTRGTMPYPRQTAFVLIEDLEQLFKRPWITRVWTFQEILLATNPVLVCGNFHVPWAQLELSLSAFAGLHDLVKVSASWRSVVRARSQIQLPHPSAQGAARVQLSEYMTYIEEVWKVSDRIDICLVFVIVLGPVCCMAGIAACFAIQQRLRTSIVIIILVLILGVLAVLQPGMVDRQTANCTRLIATVEREAAPTTNSPIDALYSRIATNPKDMAFGMWAVLEKQSSVKFTAPNYACDTGEIYRSFMIHVMRVTRSFDSLIYAAACPYPGQPSWVPDWSAHNRNNWKHLNRRRAAEDDYGNDQCLSLVYDAWPGFTADPTTLILTVPAYKIATLSACTTIRAISRHFKAEERDIHIENLRWLEMQNAIHRLTSGHTHQHRGLFDILLRRKDVLRYWKKDKDPIKALANLEYLHSTNDPNGVLKVYLNRFSPSAVTRETTSFIAQYAGARVLPFCAGVCSTAAQVGDLVIRVQGLPHLLLVRLCDVSDNAVKKVSPVSLHKFTSRHKRVIAGVGS